VASPVFKYKPPGPIAGAFMKSDAFVRGIRGPVGSGKSTACCAEIMRRSCEQAPNKSGVRRSRWAVVRNTNPELKTTTIKTWLDLFPEDVWGDFCWSVPYNHNLNFMLPDGSQVELEVLFLALDRPEDVKKLLSLELTGVWGNEARELPKAVIDGMTMRVGRFPSMREGGPTWHGVLLDTNSPDEDHWWPILAGESPVPEYITLEERLMLAKPANWSFYSQPPGMLEIIDAGTKLVTGYEPNPAAENVKNLVPTYYPNMITGKTRAWIAVYVLNRLGSINDGKAVHGTFREETHVARAPLLPIDGVPIRVGLDFGLTPAAVFGQRSSRGQWLIQHELVANDMGIRRFGDLLRAECARLYPGHPFDTFIFHGDPSGDARGHDELTPFQILRGMGILVAPAPSNDPVLRIEAVDDALNRMIDGMAGYLLSPTCTVLRRAMAGGYHYKRAAVAGEARYAEKPDKNRFSHPADAQQYLFLGAGEGRRITTGLKPQQQRTVPRSSVSIFERRGGIYDRASASKRPRF
jgi:hypothetical protein